MDIILSVYHYYPAIILYITILWWQRHRRIKAAAGGMLGAEAPRSQISQKGSQICLKKSQV